MAPAFSTYTKTFHTDVYPGIHASRPELSQKGKRVVITGAAVGIGAATAEAFAIAGASEVVILGRTQATLDATKNAIEAKHKGSKVTAVVVDISSLTSTADAFDNISKDGPIDVFINNAAYLANLGPIAAADVEDWWKSIEVNVKGALHVLQSVLKNISKHGVIINVSSGVTHAHYIPDFSSYAVGKAGAARLFEYVQNENPDLRVFNLHPGVILSTGLASKGVEQSGAAIEHSDTLELPGNLMVWLSSPEAVFLKGRFLWANWDVEELKQRSKEFQENPLLLTLGLTGWPQ
ncbi:uncharacterized protein A1O9_06065 [Exophiala aquamarina CBS 119918]|uniref:Oxidoreductase n=1 Tax=Exophiala aquamarina CBS 119918 TaxID=1182545 RepID=A0A072PE56_9EURO|nr:uncharacterized protein A1O9_06065 [Exophiala aquamarina CBS 119918]KEF58141.1 hypothetical protein A1O9_06065 [Exophiala aquamarina CBS 119918]